jgi:pimeloyl-ACP methyl ester carboxylesterase
VYAAGASPFAVIDLEAARVATHAFVAKLLPSMANASQIALHQGCRIAYTAEGAGPPVLFIQGVGLPGAGWGPQTEALRENYRVIAFDNRGTGASDTATADLSVEQMADDALAVLDANNVSSAHVVGHSLGGLIALQLALNARNRVRSLSLLCTFADGRSAAPLTARMIWLGLRSRVGTRRSRRKGFLRLIMSPEELREANPDTLAEMFAPLFGHDLADQPPVVSRQLKAMRAANLSARLAELHGLPTLVVSTGYDPIAPPSLGRKLASMIESARFVEITNASHGVLIEFPDKINGLLLDHFAKIEA